VIGFFADTSGLTAQKVCCQCRPRSADQGSMCYKFLMPKLTQRWLLFKYVGGEFTPLSKPLKTKEHAEQARLKYPEQERRTIGLGAIRLPKDE